MSTHPQGSFKLKVGRSITDNPNMRKSEASIKKASTFPNDLPFEMEFYALDPESYENNPFLRARIKAYLCGITKSKEEKIGKKEQQCDSQAPLFPDERVTLKKICQTRTSLNHSTASELKKLIGQGLPQQQK